ncbi:MAG: hypothetical protein K2J08_04260 [Ruminococcus sp.]|nr:hypothetical protein [Ruminococcus sp.]
MKKIILIIVNIIIIAFIGVMISIKAFPKSEYPVDIEKCVCVDVNGILGDTGSINDSIRKTAEKLGFNIMIYVAGSADADKTDYEIERYSENIYDDNFGAGTSGLIYYIDVSGRSPAYDYLSASGFARDIYRNKYSDITEYAGKSLPPSTEPVKKEHVSNAINAFLRDIESYAKSPVDYTLILLCFGIGVATFIILFFAIKYRYRFKHGQDSAVYVAGDKTHFTNEQDIFIREYTTKTKIQTSSHSGGSHGGGGHSGGGSHR